MSPSVKQRAVLWPYILALGCLFALSLVAPRGWQRADGTSGAPAGAARRLGGGGNEHRAPRFMSETAAIVHPTPELPPVASALSTPATTQALPATSPLPEEPAEKVADQWRFGASAELNGTGHPPQPTLTPPVAAPTAIAPPIVVPPVDCPPPKTSPAEKHVTGTPTLAPPTTIIADARESKLVTAAVEPPEQKSANRKSPDEKQSELEITSIPNSRIAALTKSVVRPPTAPVVKPPAAQSPPSAESPAAQSKSSPHVPSPPARQPIVVAPPAPAWPLPKSLLARLHELAKHDECHNWANSVCREFEQLNRLSPDECARRRWRLLQELHRLAEQATPLAASATARAPTCLTSARRNTP